jgi:uncharacterized protein (DUF302 family)
MRGKMPRRRTSRNGVRECSMDRMTASTLPPGAGVVTKPSPHSAAETLARLERAVRAKGLTVFAHIDHAAGAAKAGLHMPPAHVLIFGNPKAGTPIMLAAPLAALALPLKVLVWDDHDGRTYVSYDSPRYLADRFAIPGDLVGNLAGIDALTDAAIA